MLKATFSPILHTIPTKSGPPKLSRVISSALAQTPPTVRQNASANITTTNPTHRRPPTSAYIHLPFCRKRCHYCDFPIVALGSSPTYDDNTNDPRMLSYVQLLCREIQATQSESNRDQPLETIFFGGGTPSLVPPRLVSSVLETLSSKFGLHLDAEISMEMDPGTFDANKMKGLMELGVNRVSLGAQAFQDELLKACGRAHGVKEVHEAIEIVGLCGVENWSMDLISSLPHQTSEMWEESLILATEAQPKHLSVYDLQVEQGTKFGILYTPGEFPLPSETQSADFYKMASSMLSNAGYNHYEISSYSKSSFECKHNLTYWENKPFYGFGLSSASFLDGVRFSRPKKMKEYRDYVQNLEDGILEYREDGCSDVKDMAMDSVMLSFRTARGLDMKSFKETFGSSLVHALCKAYRPYVESGHVVYLDRHRRAVTKEQFCSLVSDELDIEETVAFIRLSDPDGFLLSNELISLAFTVISP